MPNISRIYFSALTVILLFLAMLTPLNSIAQNSVNIPYSLYGLGELRHNQYLQNMGMGGINQAFRSNISINDVNPASYAAIDSTSFVFESTLFAHFYEQKAADVRQQSDYISLGNLSVGFPVTSWMSFAAGLKPFSKVGYTIRESDEHPQAGMVNYFYEGSGGVNQLFFGTSLELFNGFSVGANMSYLFGNLVYEASVSSDSAGVFQTNLANNNRVSGWVIGYGVQYHHRFSDHRYLTIGATYGSEQGVNIRSTETLRRKLPGEMAFDTIAHFELAEDRLTIPTYYGAGIYGRFNRNWAAGIDYQWQNWESFNFLNKPDQFNDSYRIALGVEFRPTIETFSTLLHRMRYSGGIRYGQSYFMPNGEELTEFGISFGTFVPIRGTLSGLRINFEYSRRDPGADQMMQENFYMLNIGINIYERWFIRRLFH